ncbi:Regulatory protein munI [Planktothrix serta PCC 8927]|uniref:Regulatory protein munI n=1 Tax=Planktothrix serta PCC 8927 TaxID=671068 RepID=A0A7Z9DZL8_9CYAN|nr:helix-turn-helix transcriptional regulator [Planktothrix serta]VXD20435.1 Regulatory protein munI [Planktothrix serta PCC 8927]
MKKKHPWLVDIGKNIRAIRESKGLSQEELAELVEIDRTYIGGIERGERNVASLNLIRIAIALNTEVGNLFPRLDMLPLISRY